MYLFFQLSFYSPLSIPSFPEYSLRCQPLSEVYYLILECNFRSSSHHRNRIFISKLQLFSMSVLQVGAALALPVSLFPSFSLSFPFSVSHSLSLSLSSVLPVSSFSEADFCVSVSLMMIRFVFPAM